MGDISSIISNITVMAIPILLAVTFHELAHGWAAYKLGDNTARDAGRLTLNPIRHLDLVGTLAFIVTQMIGWAKPVPVNPANFRNPKTDNIWVSVAGPFMNLVLAGFFALLFHGLIHGRGIVPEFFFQPLIRIAQYGVIINIGLAVFNLLPIPPLDGSHILEGLLPNNLAWEYSKLRPYGFIILLLLILTNAVDYIVFPVVRYMVNGLLG